VWTTVVAPPLPATLHVTATPVQAPRLSEPEEVEVFKNRRGTCLACSASIQVGPGPVKRQRSPHTPHNHNSAQCMTSCMQPITCLGG
jgi:hypothetical protein